MAEIDPITREALKRASQMYSRPKAPSRHHPNEKSEPPVQERKHEKNDDTPKPEPKNVTQGDPVKAFFRDKEESVILLLIMLLMDEKTDPSLLLALMYLLI